MKIKLILALIVLFSITGCTDLHFHYVQNQLDNKEYKKEFGDYPDDFLYIINNNEISKDKPMNKPTKYETTKGTIGWAVCMKDASSNLYNKRIFIINHGEVTEESTPYDKGISNTCDYLKQKNPINSDLVFSEYNNQIRKNK